MSEQPKKIGGAFRSGELPRLRDVPPELEYYAARAFTEGVQKYEAGLNGTEDLYPWDKNWEKGDITDALVALDHFKAHVLAIVRLANLNLRRWEAEEKGVQNGDPWVERTSPRVDGETLTVHLEHAAANLAMLCKFNEDRYFEAPPNPRTNGEILGLKPIPPNPETIPAEVNEDPAEQQTPALESPSIAETAFDAVGLGWLLKKKD